jgi:hypothetical protein
MSSKPSVKKSFDWLFNRFSGASIKPCQFDIDCLTSIAETTNAMSSKAFQENTIFAKMYVYALMHELDFYKDIHFATKKLDDVLNNSLENTAKEFSDRLNHLELNKHLHEMGINTDHLKILSEEDELKEAVLRAENYESIKKYVLGVFDEENVFKSLSNAITNCIINFRNKD